MDRKLSENDFFIDLFINFVGIINFARPINNNTSNLPAVASGESRDTYKYLLLPAVICKSFAGMAFSQFLQRGGILWTAGIAGMKVDRRKVTERGPRCDVI